MKLKKTGIAISALPLFLTALTSHADVTRLDSVIVIGEGAGPSTDQLAGSYDVITREELEYEHPDDTYELFDKVSGVYLSRYNQGIINTDIAIRGFAGDGVTPHTKLLIDGIPFNLNNGYGELDQLFPLDIESIEVFKGTSDARYGLFNLAGNSNVTSRRDIVKEIKLTAGSFNTQEVQGYAGLESGRLTHHYFLGYRQGEGYRDHTDIDKLQASGKWFYALSDDSEVGFSIRHSTYEADSPGYFDVEEEARRTPTSSASHSSEDGGDKTVNHYSVHFNTALTSSINWSTKAYYNDIERNRWVRFFSTSTLQERVDDQQQTGFISTVDWQINEQWSLDVGVDLEQQDVVEQRFSHADNLRAGTGVNTRDRRYSLNTLGAFASVEQTPSDLLRWNVGLRLDRLDGRRFDNDGEIFDYGTIAQPKANVFITPNEDVTLFANYGRSFQHPTGSSTYTTGDTSARDVSINDGWELGSKWFVGDDAEIRLSYWEQVASDEFITIDGESRNVGETHRQGVDVGLNIDVNDVVGVWANYSLIDSEIVRAADENTEGNELRSIPDYTASVGFNYAISSHLATRVHVDSQGDYYVNENNEGGKFGGYTIVNAGLDYTTNVGVFSVQINNVFDEYYEYVFDFGNNGTSNIYSPGDGINASLTYSYKFD